MRVLTVLYLTHTVLITLATLRTQSLLFLNKCVNKFLVTLETNTVPFCCIFEVLFETVQAFFTIIWRFKFLVGNHINLLITPRSQTVPFLTQTVLIVLVTCRSLTVLILTNTVHIPLVTFWTEAFPFSGSILPDCSGYTETRYTSAHLQIQILSFLSSSRSYQKNQTEPRATFSS